jgi:hypothetical protein
MALLHARYPVNLLVGRLACPERKEKKKKNIQSNHSMSSSPCQFYQSAQFDQPAWKKKNHKQKNNQSSRKVTHIFDRADKINQLTLLVNQQLFFFFFFFFVSLFPVHVPSD